MPAVLWRGWPVLLAMALMSSLARAFEAGSVDGKPIRVDLTNTTTVAQHFNAREGERAVEQGYGSAIDKLNAIVLYDRFTLGTRVEGFAFWLRPEDRTYADAADKRNALVDGASRYRDAVYPAKLWITYRATEVEVTVGDAYVQMGRGLVLSMRRVDDLGIDTTLFGGKINAQHDLLAATLVAGVANPSRFDDATGRSLLLPKSLPKDIADSRGPQPLFGSDRIVAGEVQAGRGTPVILGTRAALLTRCAPYAYDDAGRVKTGILETPVGTCEALDRSTWTPTLPATSPVTSAERVVNASQSVEISRIFSTGTLYVEAAIQRRESTDTRQRFGNAIYGTFTYGLGPVTSTLEAKSYRNFYPLSASVNAPRASAFSSVAYSAPPTTEAINQEQLGFVNACVTGGRLRTDVRLRPNFLVYGTVAHAVTTSEVPGGGCDASGRSTASNPKDTTTTIWDTLTGFEWRFDHDRSWLFASAGARSDVTENDSPYNQERRIEYDWNQRIRGPFALELAGRHRARKIDQENLRDGVSHAWHEGDHTTSLKIAPKWIFSQGFEYTTQAGLPTYYVNGSVAYRFNSESDVVRVFVGQQRGGLRCVSGVCKVFPPFEGARAEMTLRF